MSSGSDAETPSAIVRPAATAARLHPLPAAVRHRRVDDRDDLAECAVQPWIEGHQLRGLTAERDRQLRCARGALQRRRRGDRVRLDATVVPEQRAQRLTNFLRALDVGTGERTPARRQPELVEPQLEGAVAVERVVDAVVDGVDERLDGAERARRVLAVVRLEAPRIGA